MNSRIILTLALFSFSSCDTTDPPQGEPSVQFLPAEVLCTEVWLQVKFLSTSASRGCKIVRDSVTVFDGNIAAIETLIVDVGLSPNRGYSYSLENENDIPLALISTVRTLDTTSHEVVWQVDTLGDGDGAIYDISIFNNQLTYAGGEIHLRDSLGQIDPIPYTFAIWNGLMWEIKRPYRSSSPIQTIYGLKVFGPSDIWIATGSVYRWDGTSAEVQLSFSRLNLPDPNGTIVNLMGLSNSNLYGSGAAGSIVHRNGTSWNQFETGTNFAIADIYQHANGGYVWACSINPSNAGTGLLRKEENGGWETVYDGTHLEFTAHPDSISGTIAAVFSVNNSSIYTGTNLGIYHAPSNTRGKARRIGYQLQTFPSKIRGSAHNDLFLVGNGGVVAHFNGITWKKYGELSFGNYGSVDVRGNSVVAVGESNNRPIVARGTRH